MTLLSRLQDAPVGTDFCAFSAKNCAAIIAAKEGA